MVPKFGIVPNLLLDEATKPPVRRGFNFLSSEYFKNREVIALRIFVGGCLAGA